MKDGSQGFKDKTCCVAGHSDIPTDKQAHIKKELRREVEQAIADGYLYFLTDLMEGTDQLFAEVVGEIREETGQRGGDNKVRLEAVLPYRNRAAKLLGNKKTSPLIEACTEIGVWGEKYIPGCYAACRKRQLERSSRMIVVFDGRPKGGTVKAIRMAHAKRVAVKEISLGL
jgi:hypothetical protein